MKRPFCTRGLLVAGVMLVLPCLPVLAASRAELGNRIRQVVEHGGTAGRVAGICIVDVRTGDVLFAQRADELFIIASNAKLVSTAAALALLGPDYKFETTLWARGRIRGGVLQGDLVIRGGGDPNLSGRFYGSDVLAVIRQWIYAVRQAGITEIEGDVVADDRAFDRQFVHPEWPPGQLPYWYCAQVAALSFNDNCVDIRIRARGAPGSPVELSTSPPTSYVTLINRCAVQPGASAVSLSREAETNCIVVSGTHPPDAGGTVIYATIHNPPLYVAHVVAEQLVASGIPVRRRPRVVEAHEDIRQGATLVAKTETPMSTAVIVANRRSQNFYSEMILKTLGYEKSGRGSFASGIAAAQEFLDTVGLARGTYQMADGSGLSRSNRFTPAQVAAILVHMYHHRTSDIYMSSLVREANQHPLRGLPARYRDRVFAKTGTLRGVSALSGYVIGERGRRMAFSLLCNGAGLGTAHQLQTQVLRELLEFE